MKISTEIGVHFEVNIAMHDWLTHAITSLPACEATKHYTVRKRPPWKNWKDREEHEMLQDGHNERYRSKGIEKHSTVVILLH